MKSKMPKLPKINLTYSESKIMGLSLTTPAVIAFLAYITLAVVIMLPFEFPVTDETGKEYIVKYDFAQRLVVLLLMSIPIALSVYTINCMISGNCVLWSYVVSIISVFWVALFIITALLYTMKK
jgi:hypothetical protein